MINRTSLALCLVTAVALGACSNSTNGDGAQQSSSDVVGSGGSGDKCCDPAKKPPPGIEGEWCCGDGSWQYDIGSGNQTVSCQQHGGPGAVCGGGGGEACGPPPPVALCAECPGDDIYTMFKWIDGKPTCECCNAAPAKTCGPINGPITCAACPGGKDSYVYKDGKATCECCN